MLTEATAVKETLYEWQSPAEMKDGAERLRQLLGHYSMFSQGRAFREAHIAARFAIRRGGDAVRLLAERPGIATPDFAIRLDGQELRIETTEADIPGRKRQDEYRQPPRTEAMIFTKFETMVEHMRTLAAKKAAKAYDACHGLVIYLNPPIFSFEPSARWDGLLRAAEPAAVAFREVWIMRGAGALVWLDGQPQAEEPGIEF